MARPPKTGIDYFPLDVALDDKFGLIEAEFGMVGFGVVIKLLQKIYGGEGYYIKWTEEASLLLARTCGIEKSRIDEIANAALRRGIFSAAMFRKHGILTSAGIQRRFLLATARRSNCAIREEYDLTEGGLCMQKPEFMYAETTQSKGNKKESKENKRNGGTADAAPTPEKRNFRPNVRLTEDEYAVLKRDFGGRDTEAMLDILDNYKAMHGKSYKSDAAAIRDWVVDRLRKRGYAKEPAKTDSDALASALHLRSLNEERRAESG